MADGSVIFDTSLSAKGFEKGLNDLAKGAAATAAGVTAALGGMATAAISAGSDFEASMSQVAATMGLSVAEINAGSESFEILSTAAKEAGESTAFSASEAAEGLNFLALAGYDAATAAEVLPSVLNLAAAGGMDLAYASDLATDAMAALGIEAGAENLTTFGDKMARTASKASTSVAQLGEAILTVGGTAKVLAGGTTELNTVLGLLANEGTKGSEAGTALRNVILSLTAPTDKAAAKIKELELNVADANGDLRPLNDIFKDLNASLDEMSSTDKTKALNEVFNKVDLKSVQTLLANCGEQFDNLSAAIDDSGGAMQQMADVQLDNLKGDLTILGSAAEGLGVAFYENIKGTAREAVQDFTDTLTSRDFRQSFDELSGAAGDMIEMFAGLASDALPVLVDGLTFLASNLTNIIGLAGGAYAAFKTFTTVKQAADWVYTLAQNFGTAALQIGLYTTANGAAAVSQAVLAGKFSVFEVVVGVITGKISLATAAQWAWNAAMTANPAGLVVAAIAALAAGIGVYVLATRDSMSPTEQFRLELQREREEMYELTDSMRDNAKAREDIMRDTEDETRLARELADSIFSLNEQESLSAQQKAELASKVQMLNDLIPDLNLTLDEETGHLKNQKDEVYQSIDAWEKLARTKAAQDAQIEIYKDRINAERELFESGERLAKLEEKRAELIGDLTEYQIRLAASAGTYSARYSDLYNARQVEKEIEAEKAAMGELQSAYDEAGKQLEWYQNIITENYVPAQQAAAESTSNLAGAQQNAIQPAADAAQAQSNLGDSVQEAAEKISGGMTQAADITAEKAQAIEASVENTAEAVGGAAGDIQQSAVTVGESSGSLLDGVSNVFTIISSVFGGAKDGANDADSGIQSAASGIQGSFGKVNEAARIMHEGLTAELKPLPGEFGEAAQQSIDSMNTALINGQPVVQSNAQGIKDAAVNAVNSLPDELYTVGVNAIQGLGDGMQSKSGWLANVAAGIVSKAIAAMKKEADINSPSKRAAKEIGAPIIDGIGVGIEKQLPQLSGLMRDDVSALLSQIRSVIAADQSYHPAAQSGNPQSSVYNDSHNTDMNIRVYYTSQAGARQQDAADISREIARQAQWKMRAAGVIV